MLTEKHILSKYHTFYIIKLRCFWSSFQISFHVIRMKMKIKVVCVYFSSNYLFISVYYKHFVIIYKLKNIHSGNSSFRFFISNFEILGYESFD